MNRQAPIRRAVIDIGTNSVKLLVADVADGLITPICETSRQTRLGAGFYSTRQLQPPAIALSAEAVAEYSAKAAELGAMSLRVFATSAAREAHNAHELSEAIRERAGKEMEILSGDKEAEWVFRGVTSNPQLAHSPALVLDVGGGSTEFIVGDEGVPQFRHSYSIGTVRMLEQLTLDDPPGLAALAECRAKLRTFLAAEVAPFLEPALRSEQGRTRLVGTGGTATILARIEQKLEEFDRTQIETARITLSSLHAHLEEQWQMTLLQRQQIVGMPAKRADVILTGMAIYEAIMEQFGFGALEVSTRGLRYWAVAQG